VPRLLEPLQFMWIRRAGLGLHGKARAAIAGHHLKDRIDARMRPASRGEVFYRQAGLSQPAYSIHKHKVDYKHSGDNFKMLMTVPSTYPAQERETRSAALRPALAAGRSRGTADPSCRPNCELVPGPAPTSGSRTISHAD